MLRVLQVLLATFLVANAAAAEPAKQQEPEAFKEALSLIHAFSGSGDELQRAMKLADQLSFTHANSGYSETLLAEAWSTWQLGQDGEPVELRNQIIALADRAISLNPRLAQAHVARGRALLRASEYEEAGKSIDAALKIEPNNAGAIFLKADGFRRFGLVNDAEYWYLKFIDATPDKPRKSNGYFWIAWTFQTAAANEPSQSKAYLAKARSAYEKSVELEPEAAWKITNAAVFLNNEGADYAAAEKYAERALKLMEFPVARYHLAIARYQKLLPASISVDDLTFHRAVREVHESTHVSLDEAVQFAEGTPCYYRLRAMQARVRTK